MKDIERIENMVKDGVKYMKPTLRNIKMWREYYKGEHWKRGMNLSSFTQHTVENLVFNNISTIKPSINLQDPRFFVKSTKKPYVKDGVLFDTNTGAFLVESLLMYYWRHFKFKRSLDKVLSDSLIGPWGIVHIGIDKDKNPFLKRVSPFDLIVDPYGTDPDLEDCGWIGIRWVKTLDAVKKDKENSGISGIKTNFTPDYLDDDDVEDKLKDPLSDMGDSSEREFILGWDIWDKENQKMIRFVPGHDKILLEKPWGLKYKAFPVKTLWFNYSPDKTIPISDVDMYLAQQDELNRLKSLQFDHIHRVSQTKYVAWKDALPAKEKEKLIFGPSGTIIESNRDPSTSIIPLRDASISQDFYMAINTVRNSIRENSGVAAHEQGRSEKFRTATEPSLIQQGVSVRRQDRSSVLEAFYVSCAEDIVNLVQQTFSKTSLPLDQNAFNQVQNRARGNLESIDTTPEVAEALPAPKLVKILGDRASVLLPWLNIDRKDILGEYDIDIEVGSTLPVNQQTRRQDAITLFQLGQASPLINREAELRKLYEAFGRHDIDDILKSPEQQQQEQAQAQQAAQAQQELAQRAEQLELEKIRMKTDVQKQKIESDASIAIINKGDRDAT